MSINKKELVDGLNDVDNSTYHADRKYLSSSVLKTVLKSLDTYYLEYVLGQKKEIPESLQATFSEGSLTHTYLLEPHLVNVDFQFYKGFRKQGKEYEEFLSTARPNIPIISSPQRHRVEQMVAAYKKRPEAVQLLTNGFAEQTICGTLYGVPIKVRFDYINVESGYIVDVKTTGYPSDVHSFKATYDSLMYGLSAALYLEMAEQYYGKKFEFYYIVLSKKDNTCDVYKLSAESEAAGRRQVITACAKYLKAKETNCWTELKEPAKLTVVTDYEVLEI